MPSLDLLSLPAHRFYKVEYKRGRTPERIEVGINHLLRQLGQPALIHVSSGERMQRVSAVRWGLGMDGGEFGRLMSLADQLKVRGYSFVVVHWANPINDGLFLHLCDSGCSTTVLDHRGYVISLGDDSCLDLLQAVQVRCVAYGYLRAGSMRRKALSGIESGHRANRTSVGFSDEYPRREAGGIEVVRMLASHEDGVVKVAFNQGSSLRESVFVLRPQDVECLLEVVVPAAALAELNGRSGLFPLVMESIDGAFARCDISLHQLEALVDLLR